MAKHNFFVYSNCDFSSKTASATRMLYYAQALADTDNKVYLVSSSSDNFDQSDFIEIDKNVFVLEHKKISTNFFAALSFLKRLYNFSKKKEGKSSFIIYPYPYFNIEFLSVLYLIFYKKQKVFYELNEVKKFSSNFHEPLSFLKLKYSIRTLYYKFRFIMMDNLMRYYSGLICISTNIQQYGKKYNSNTLRIPILTNPELKFELSNKNYRSKDYFNIGFSGSIVPSKENLIGFINVIKKANKNGHKIKFNLCGIVSSKNKKLLFEELNQNDLKFHGKLDKNELSNFLSQQDLLVVPRGYTKQNKYGFSTKLSDYMNHKKVILITDISDNSMYIKDGQNGFIVKPDDNELMFQKLIHIIENFVTIKEPISSAAYQVSKQQLDYRLFKNKLYQFLKSE